MSKYCHRKRQTGSLMLTIIEGKTPTCEGNERKKILMSWMDNTKGWLDMSLDRIHFCARKRGMPMVRNYGR